MSNYTQESRSFEDSEWGDYYSDTNYSDLAFDHKTELVEQFIKNLNQKLFGIWVQTDIFRKISNKMRILTISFDIDPAAVESNISYSPA